MLILNAKIYFYTPEESEGALSRDIKVGGHIRPAINFGNDILFSGEIIVKEKTDFIMRGEYFEVLIEMPTVEEEAYSTVKTFVKEGNDFRIQSASRINGWGKILGFIFVPTL